MRSLLAVVLLLGLGVAIWFALQSSAQQAPQPKGSLQPKSASPAPKTAEPTATKKAPGTVVADKPSTQGDLSHITELSNPPKPREDPPGAHIIAATRMRAPVKLDELTAEDDAPRAHIDKEDIREAVKMAKPGIVECYEQALEKNPELAGRLTVQFTLEKKDGVGRLMDAEILDPDEGRKPVKGIRHPFLEMCALKSLAAIEYPSPEGEGTMTVRYPFSLSPGKKEETK